MQVIPGSIDWKNWEAGILNGLIQISEQIRDKTVNGVQLWFSGIFWGIFFVCFFKMSVYDILKNGCWGIWIGFVLEEAVISVRT